MAVKVTTRNGKQITHLNPSEKGAQYAAELMANASASTGEALTKNQRAWRAGYLEARKDSAKAWKHNQKKR